MANGWQSRKEVAKRREKVLALRAQGLTQEAIAAKVGLTQQRVGQIVAAEEKRAAASQ